MSQPSIIRTIIFLNVFVVIFIFMNETDLKSSFKKLKPFKIQFFNNLETSNDNNLKVNQVVTQSNKQVASASMLMTTRSISTNTRNVTSNAVHVFNEFDNLGNEKANACIIFLLRNSDLEIFIKTITRFELNFNSRYHYPYVLFNNEEFTDEFKSKVQNCTNSTIEYGLIPYEQWSVPDWIARVKMSNDMEKMGLTHVWTVDYRHMCRYYSGFFFRHELTLKYEYYWRLDDDSYFPCKLTYDPFLYMIKNNKKYGFAYSTREEPRTIATLWTSIKKWLDTGYRNEIAKEKNTLKFLTYDNGDSLATSYCIFFNNFEIAKFSIFRSDKYLNFFNFLDKEGGFYYERWGDAPVHTYYVTLMLNRSEVHLFSDIGYAHGHRQETKNYKLTGKNLSKCESQLTKCTKKWVAVSNLEKWINNK